ncbi:MAG: hypothetical protein NE330_12255 [Lentisphaeraceae bacterium]|nr:hypothetical protein [Lentisphaeraceae bacterium]
MLIRLIFIFTLLTFKLSSIADLKESQLKAELDIFDKHFENTFSWWLKLYDVKSGGFYYSLSAKNSNGKFAPWFESTTKALNVLTWSNVLDQAPQGFKKNLIQYYQSLQEKDTGFFRDSFYGKQYTPNRLNRALGMSTSSLKLLAASPLYPLPSEKGSENTEAQEHFAHLKSEEAMLKWLKALTWNTRVWTAGSRINTLPTGLKTLEVSKKKQLLKLIEQFINNIQTADGFVGTEKDKWDSRLSGTYKVFSFYHKNGLKIPNIAALKTTVLKHFQNSEYTNLIVLYNTINILTIIDQQDNSFSINDKAKIIQQASMILNNFHAKDGGFMTRVNMPAPKAVNITLGKKVIEGNTNSTGLAHKIRLLLYTLATGKPGPFDHPKAAIFIKGLEEIHP